MPDADHASDSRNDIAIIGMACRFPGAPDVAAFWANLVGGVESIGLLDPAAAASAHAPYRERPNFRAAAGVLPDIEAFDAAFFGYSPREAELMDPQQRLFLECAWETFEDAGVVPGRVDGLVGVFAGCGINTYFINNVHPQRNPFPNRTFLESVQDFQLLLGNQGDFVATRVSYNLDLRGPSINLQTACSTSLVALHLACQSLILGECDLALAGAATLRVPQDGGYLHEDGMVFSPDGHTRAFDAHAAGTTFGSGVAAVLLKPLQDALADGDTVHAVIKGSAVNNDGALKLAFTAPSVDGQAAVIREALSVAGVEAATIGYVEAHGTATPLGDPIELAALKQAFGPLPAGQCALGTVKTNIGHLSWSAGMAGLIKTVLALKHRCLPPSLHYATPNPHAGFEDSPFRVNDRLAAWPAAPGHPRRAGVSAFGVGGTNAHVVLEEPPASPSPAPSDGGGSHVFTLSAKSEAALARSLARHRQRLESLAPEDFADACRSSNTRRAHHAHRLAVAASSLAMLRDELALAAETLAERPPLSTAPATSPRVAFLFTGQGAQYVGMARALYDSEPEFRRVLQRCEAVLAELGHASILAVLYPADAADQRLHDVGFTQTAMFCVEVALATLWRSWGVEPAVVMGHSTGEYAAACVAGVFSLEDGLKLCAERGRLFERHVSSDGRMATVQASHDVVLAALAPYRGEVSVAAVNGPLSTVVSGRRAAVDALCAALAAAGIPSKAIEVQRAGHSALTEPLLDELRRVAADVAFSSPRLPLVSNLTGTLVGAEIGSPDYWCRHTREPVLFAQGMQCLADQGVRHFLEIGPDPMLLGMGAYCLLGQAADWIPSLRRPPRFAANDAADGMARNVADDRATMAAAAARLYAAGLDLDWSRIDAGCRHVALPTYPFERTRHWIDAASTVPTAVDVPAVAPSGGDAIARATRPEWLDVDWIAQAASPIGPDHRTDGVWLLLADESGVAERLVSLIEARGGRCVRLYAAVHHERFDGGHTVRPDTPADFAIALAAVDGPLRGVVDLWPLDRPGASRWRGDADALGEAWAGCQGLLHLLQALSTRTDAPGRLALVTRDAQAARPGDTLDGLASAGAWGLARVAGMERPEWRCLRVDLPARPQPDDAVRLLEELLQPGPEDSVALRPDERRVSRLVATPVPAGDVPATITAHGSYLVTGGLGGLGLVLADWLVERGARRLVLMGRQAPGEAAAATLIRLASAGVQVRVIQADVADADALAQALVDERDLRGVFHAAGVIDDAGVPQQNRDRFLKVLAPKVQGAWNLHRLCGSLAPQLEHFVLFSSAASLIGNAGQANHAAANAVLDALAHHRRAIGRPALSVNWGAWSEVGELRHNATARQRVERLGFAPIGTAAGLQALAQAMAQPSAQKGFSPMHWSRFLSAFQLEDVAFFSQVAVMPGAVGERPSAPGASDLRARLAGLDDASRAGALRDHVRAEATRVLGMRGASEVALDDHRPLAAYGLDSLSAIELRNTLQSGLGLALPALLLMDHPTVEALTQYLRVQPWAALPTRSARGAVADPDLRAAPGLADADAPRPLSTQQSRWLSLVRAGYGARVVPIVFEAALHEAAFERALLSVVTQHELLRYVFPGDQVQVLAPEQAVPSPGRLHLDLSGLDEAARRGALADAVRQSWAEMPDPAERPSWSLRCLKYPGERFVLLLSLQHLDFDGTSLTTFVNELRAAYRAVLRDEAPPVSAVASYREYVAAQQDYLADGIAEDRAFFQGFYAHLDATTTLPRHPGFRRTEPRTASRYTARPLPGLWASLQAEAGTCGVTPFSLMLAAYARLVSEITARSTVVVAMITNGRPDGRFSNTIGPFTAPFPVLVSTAERSLRELAVQCHRSVAAITARSRFPVSDLVTSVTAFKDFPVDSYFTDVGINFTSYRRDDDGLAPRARVIEVLGPVVEPEFLAANTESLSRIPGLHLVLDLMGGELRATFWYHAERFEAAEVAGWAQRYLALFESTVSAS